MPSTIVDTPVTMGYGALDLISVRNRSCASF